MRIKLKLACIALLAGTSGCASLSAGDDGNPFGRFAARQLVVLALGGTDGLAEFNDRERTRDLRLHGTYHPLAFQETAFETFEEADKWRTYDRMPAPDEADGSRAIHKESDAEPLACSDPLNDSVICR